jgi:zinc transporter 1/2/3
VRSSLLLVYKQADGETQFGICLISLFSTFVLELCAYRVGTAYLAKRGITMEAGHGAAGYNGVDSTHGSHAIGHPETRGTDLSTEPDVQTQNAAGMVEKGKLVDSDSSLNEAYTDASEAKPAYAQIIGVAILEFGVVFHSVSNASKRRLVTMLNMLTYRSSLG